MAGTISISSLSTEYVQYPVTIMSPAGYDPTSDAVEFAFTAYTYPTTQPAGGDWHAGSWVTFAGPAYWAQCLVGPAGVTLAQGTWTAWIRITDNPEVPVLQPGMVQITP